MTRRRRPDTRATLTTAEAVKGIRDAKAAAYRYSDNYLEKMTREGHFFETWLNHLGLQLEDLAAAATPRQALPTFDAAILVEYFQHYSANHHANATTLKTRLCALEAWLAYRGFDVSELPASTTTGKALRRTIDHFCAGRATPPKPAHPVMHDELAHLVEACRTNSMGWTTLAAQAMETYITVAWTMFLRGGETVYALRWSMIHLSDEAFLLPGGRVFKWQDQPQRLSIPHDHPRSEQCGSTCPLTVLTAWRTTCVTHGVPVGPDDYVFPAIRTYPPDHPRGRTPQQMTKFGERLFVPDYVGEYCARHGDTPERRTMARSNLFHEYLGRWRVINRAAATTVDRSRHTGGTHGLRRGGATQSARNGTHPNLIAQRLRHGPNSAHITGLYVEPSLADTTTLLELPNCTDKLTLDAALTINPPARDLACQIEHHGQACGRGGRLYLKIVDGHAVLLCGGHYGRFMIGKTGDELSRPLRSVRGRTPRRDHKTPDNLSADHPLTAPCSTELHASGSVDG